MNRRYEIEIEDDVDELDRYEDDEVWICQAECDGVIKMNEPDEEE